MRTLPALLLLAACSTVVPPAREGVTVALPRAMIDELRAESERQDQPISTLLADAWAYHGTSVSFELSTGERLAPDFSRADRQGLECWFDHVVAADLQLAAARTGVDQGALLATAWRIQMPRPANVLAAR